MAWRDEFLNITWEDFRKLSFNLSQQIQESKLEFDLIVTIARGGLALARLLSDNLGFPIASFTVQSYKDLKQTSIPHIIYGLGAKLANKKILLVDDVSDSGKTFIRGIAYLEELGAKRKHIKTAAMYYKPLSIYKPDFYVGTTSKWIIHPYETGETMKTLIREWKKAKVSVREIKQRFEAFGFLPDQIELFLS